MTPKPLSVLIADDSAIFRKVLRDLLEAYDRFEVAGVARNGQEALEQVEEKTPDALILDVEMPVMDGLSTLKALKSRFPETEVLMFSSLTQDGAEITFQALELGAFDFVGKPRANSVDEGLAHIRSDLIPKLTFLHTRKTLRTISSGQFSQNGCAAGERGILQAKPTCPPSGLVKQRTAAPALKRNVVALGVSTGGPKALAALIPALPANLAAGLLIVQHMPPVFTRTLAQRLDDKSSLEVREAQTGDEVRPGLALIAPGGWHMTVNRENGGGVVRVSLDDGPAVNNCRPSVDVLFRSVLRTYGQHSIGVIMTGMGSDGVRELARLKAKGGYVIAQNEKTCTVFGMPRKIVEEGLADLVLPLEEIAPAIAKTVSVAGCQDK